MEPIDKTAIAGDTVILPCRVANKVGTLQCKFCASFILATKPELCRPGFRVVALCKSPPFSYLFFLIKCRKIHFGVESVTASVWESHNNEYHGLIIIRQRAKFKLKSSKEREKERERQGSAIVRVTWMGCNDYNRYCLGYAMCIFYGFMSFAFFPQLSLPTLIKFKIQLSKKNSKRCFDYRLLPVFMIRL